MTLGATEQTGFAVVLGGFQPLSGPRQVHVRDTPKYDDLWHCVRFSLSCIEANISLVSDASHYLTVVDAPLITTVIFPFIFGYCNIPLCSGIGAEFPRKHQFDLQGLRGKATPRWRIGASRVRQTRTVLYALFSTSFCYYRRGILVQQHQVT